MYQDVLKIYNDILWMAYNSAEWLKHQEGFTGSKYEVVYPAQHRVKHNIGLLPVDLGLPQALVLWLGFTA